MITQDWSPNHLHYVCDYQPYRVCGQENPHKNTDTYRIMDIKNPDSRNYEQSLKYFQGELLSFFRAFPNLQRYQHINLAIVPSSTMGNVSASLESIVQFLNLNLRNTPRIMYNRNFLLRTASIPSSHNGGVRNEQLHMNSIAVNTPIEADVPLILLDDVYTTGCSMNACARLLRNAGVRNIYKLALGKTV